VEHADFLPVITAEARGLADAARAMDLDARVPSCPEWDVAKLVRHTGTAHRWSAEVVRTRAALSPKSIDLEVPDTPSGLPDWLEASAARLTDTLAATDPDAECWTWTDAHHVRFWSRRMAHETLVHHWDGERVRGEPPPIGAALAVDGIDEHLVNLPFIVGPEQSAGSGETLHLHCTDRDGEWLAVLSPGGLAVTREHAKGDVALKGSAAQLFLVLLGRAPVTTVEQFGDPAALARWQPLLGF
jgi:uncharacterized protein (TIGR03083 family)